MGDTFEGTKMGAPRNFFSKFPMKSFLNGYTVGRVENQKSLIFFKSQAGLYGAHKNKVIHHILKFQNISFHIGNTP